VIAPEQKKPPGASRCGHLRPFTKLRHAVKHAARQLALRAPRDGGEPRRGPAGQGRPTRGSGVCRVFADRRLAAPTGRHLAVPASAGR